MQGEFAVSVSGTLENTAAGITAMGIYGGSSSSGDDEIESGSNSSLLDKTPKEISDLTRKQLKDSVPNGWSFHNHNGRIHIKDEKGNYRIHIDLLDNKTNYTHIHILDENENPLDINGNIVSSKDPSGHIPYNN